MHNVISGNGVSGRPGRPDVTNTRWDNVYFGMLGDQMRQCKIWSKFLPPRLLRNSGRLRYKVDRKRPAEQFAPAQIIHCQIWYVEIGTKNNITKFDIKKGLHFYASP